MFLALATNFNIYCHENPNLTVGNYTPFPRSDVVSSE